jgi:hypothetical protein
MAPSVFPSGKNFPAKKIIDKNSPVDRRRIPTVKSAFAFDVELRASWRLYFLPGPAFPIPPPKKNDKHVK